MSYATCWIFRSSISEVAPFQLHLATTFNILGKNMKVTCYSHLQRRLHLRALNLGAQEVVGKRKHEWVIVGAALNSLGSYPHNLFPHVVAHQIHAHAFLHLVEANICVQHIASANSQGFLQYINSSAQRHPPSGSPHTLETKFVIQILASVDSTQCP